MYIKKNKRIKKIKIESNWKLLIIIMILLIILIFLIFKIMNNSNKKSIKKESLNEFECLSDSDCVASECCHAKSCVNKNFRPNCSNVVCTMDCSGPLDCGQGYCVCINNKCSIFRE
ncbi:MAG: hypothetical protein QXW97_03665 [Candidatus Pacearchaeota archaeon]